MYFCGIWRMLQVIILQVNDMIFTHTKYSRFRLIERQLMEHAAY